MTYKQLLSKYFKPIVFVIRPIHPEIMQFSDPCNREALIKRTIKRLEFDPAKEAEDRFDEFVDSTNDYDPLSEYDLFYPSWLECLSENVSVCMKEELKIKFENKYKAYLFRLSELLERIN